MKVLHTSDWHVGKRLERYDRLDEHSAVIAEVADLAAAEAVDLVLHSVTCSIARCRPSRPAVRTTGPGALADVRWSSRNHDSPICSRPSLRSSPPSASTSSGGSGLPTTAG
jgi:hypothetical protein